MGTGATDKRFPFVSGFSAIESSNLLHLLDPSDHTSGDVVWNARTDAHTTFDGVHDIFGQCGDIVYVCLCCVGDVWSSCCKDFKSFI